MKKLAPQRQSRRRIFRAQADDRTGSGDQSSWYCVLDEAGSVVFEQRLSTTPKAMREVFGAVPRSRIALETGMHSPWVSRVLSELGHEVRGACAQGALDRGEPQER